MQHTIRRSGFDASAVMAKKTRGQQLTSGRSRAQRILSILRERISSGELPRGVWLREPQLASEFGVSRTPVRMALDGLCEKGLAERIPNRGVRLLRGRKSGLRPPPQVEIDMRTLNEQVYDELLARIMTSRGIGLRTSVVELAKDLGVSRSPVRRALDRLSSFGLVESGHRQGVFFSRVDARRVAEVYDVRAELEGLAAERAAERIEPATVRDLISENRQLLKSQPEAVRARFVSQELDLHEAIAESCGQSYLRKVLSDIFTLVSAFQRAGYHARAMARQATREHGLILDALRRRDGKLARKRMVRHVRSTCRQILAATQGG